jgi:hypothetical protein
VKANISRGAGFSGLCRYVLDLKEGSKGNKRAEVIGGNIAGSSYNEIMRNFAVVRRIRPDIMRPVWHCSLSFPPGESPDNDLMVMIAAEFMRRMEFPEINPYSIVRHHDTAHEHIHIIASRVGFDGKVWRGSFEMYKAIRVTQELEVEFGLVQTEGYQGKQERKNPKFGERQMEARTGVASPKVQLQELIDEVTATNPTVVEFCEYLEASGVEVRANLASTGKLNGFSFAIDDIAFKGSNLGKDYTWGGLQKRGVSYEPGRDFGGLGRFAAGTGRRPMEEQGQAGASRTGAVLTSPKERLQKLIDEITATKPTVVEFCEYLETKGIKIKANLATTGRLNGFSFITGGVSFKGTDLGKSYTWGQLQEQGVSYELGRDFDGLKRFAAGFGRWKMELPESAKVTEITRPIEEHLIVEEEIKTQMSDYKDPDQIEFLQQPKNKLKRLIDQIVANRPSALELCERLETLGVEVRANLATTGKLNGFTFTINDVKFKGSSLGKAYAWSGLQERGVTYEPGRDKEGLERFKTSAATQSAIDGAGNIVGGIEETDPNLTPGGGAGSSPITQRGGPTELESGKGSFRDGEGDRQVEVSNNRAKQIPRRYNEPRRPADRRQRESEEILVREVNLDERNIHPDGRGVLRDGDNGVFTQNIRKALADKKEWEKNEIIRKEKIKEEKIKEEKIKNEKIRKERKDKEAKLTQNYFEIIDNNTRNFKLPLWLQREYIIEHYAKEDKYYVYPKYELNKYPTLIIWSRWILVKTTDEQSILTALRVGKEIWPRDKPIKICGDDEFKAMIRNVNEKYKIGFDIVSDSEMIFKPKQELVPETQKQAQEQRSDKHELKHKKESEEDIPEPEKSRSRLKPK